MAGVKRGVLSDDKKRKDFKRILEQMEQRDPSKKTIRSDVSIGFENSKIGVDAQNKRLSLLEQDATLALFISRWKENGGEVGRVDLYLTDIEVIDARIIALQAERDYVLENPTEDAE